MASGWVLRELESGGVLDQFLLAVTVERHDPDHGRVPAAQSAGLVERHSPQAGRLLDVGAAFDQNPVPSRGGKRRHDAHGGRDHEGAGTGDHQEDERPVEPVTPRRVKQDRRHNADRDRERDYRGRIDAGKLLDPLLGARAPTVRLLDHARDAGERRILGDPGALDLERAIAVDRTGEDLAARLLGGRQALAGDRRLVDRADSGDDAAVERDALARVDDEARADRRCRRRDLALLAGGGDRAHGRRCQVEQGGDRAACSADAPALEGEGQGEEKRNGGGLEPFADADRTRDRDHHQEIDVGPQAPGGVPRFDQHVADAEADRERIGDDLGQRHGLSAVPEQPQRFREPARKPGVQHEADQHREAAQGGEPDLQAAMALVTAILVPARLPTNGAHAGALDGGRDVAIGHVPRRLGNRHPAVQNIKCKVVLAAHERPDLTLEDRHLLCAIETRDLEDPPARTRLPREDAAMVVATAGVIAALASRVRLRRGHDHQTAKGRLKPPDTKAMGAPARANPNSRNVEASFRRCRVSCRDGIRDLVIALL